MMKVGILSVVPTCGKTTLTELLAGVFTITQGRTAAIFSTGDLSDFEKSVELSTQTGSTEPDIVRAFIETNSGDEMLLDYGARVGMENVYLYNVLGAEMEEYDRIDFLKKAIKAIPVDLTLVEFTGDLSSEINQSIIKELDCCLCLVYPSWKAIDMSRNIRKQLPQCTAVTNMIFVSAMIDPKNIGDKKMATLLGTKQENLLRFPRVDTLQKESLVGHLDTCCGKIVAGEGIYAQLRQPLQEVMQYIFDTQFYNVIRPIDKWYG